LRLTELSPARNQLRPAASLSFSVHDCGFLRFDLALKPDPTACIPEAIVDGCFDSVFFSFEFI
jgi:hypothetical protein